MNPNASFVRFLPIVVHLLAAAQLSATDADMLSPVPGSNLTSSTVTFTWSEGPGGYWLYVGTEGTASSDVFNSGYISPGTTSRVVTGVPTDRVVYVRLWCETAPGSGSYLVSDHTHNADIDADGILDTLDPNPGFTDPMFTRTGSDFELTLLGSGRIANLVSEDLFNATFNDVNTTEARALSARVYEHLQDDFDFIIVASNQRSVPSGSYFGRFYNAQNSIEGIGKSAFDSTALFGSAGRLQGVIHLTSMSGLPGGPSLHELAHNWGNSMDSVPTAVGGHWGYSNIGGQLGGWQPNSLEDLDGGQYRARNPRTGNIGNWGGNANGGNGLPYSNFELYVMGLITAEEVGHDIRIANDFAWVDAGNGIFQASGITTYTMSEVVTADGVRSPSATTSQKSFRVLYVVLSAEPLSLAEWAEFDEDVYKFALPGDDGSSLYNFWEATGGRATLQMDNLVESLLSAEFLITQVGTSVVDASVVQVELPSESGFNYTLQYRTTVPGSNWSDGESKTGTGGALALSHDTVGNSTMFFRVRRE